MVLVADVPSCVRDLELNFFPQTLVNEALSLHGISQSNWTVINYELGKRIKKVPQIVTKNAGLMIPNPIGPPYQPLILQQIVEAALLEVFKETMSLFRIYTDNQVAEMFAYIRNKQKLRLIGCFGEPQVPKSQNL